MIGSGSPCGACKFLRRKCVKGCVFAPYFCHEQGPAHFAAIHRVFGASNVSKLLAHLPVSGQYEAAITIAYEAQARLQDPIYGCVSHIFALQQQVVSLQSQLASLKTQASRSELNVSGSNYPPYTPQQDIYTCFQQFENSCVNMPQFDQQTSINTMNFNSMGNSMGENYENSYLKEEGGSFSSFQEGYFFQEDSSYSIDSLDIQKSHNKEWSFHENTEDLHSVVFGYVHR